MILYDSFNLAWYSMTVSKEHGIMWQFQRNMVSCDSFKGTWYHVDYWFEKARKHMYMWTGRRDMTEKLLKAAINPNQSMNQNKYDELGNMVIFLG